MNEKNSNDDRLPEEIKSNNINLNAGTEGHMLHNDTGKIQKDQATSENILKTEESRIDSLSATQNIDLGMASSNLDNHQNEQIEDNSIQKNMYTHIEHKPERNELSDIDSASVVQSVGHLLRKARVMKGMSVEDVSRQLRLSVLQIEAIEKENYEKLPGRTFLRGFIRNYANLVQLDPIPLLQLLPESTPVISTYERTPFKNKQISFSSNRENSGNNRLTTAIIFFTIIAGAYFIFVNDIWIKTPETNSVSDVAKFKSGTASVEIQLPLPGTAKTAINSQTNQQSEINDEKSSEAELDTKTEAIQAKNKPVIQGDEKSTATPRDSGNLYFQLTGDSWIKVVDGTGASLFEQLKKSGSEQVITGKRPLSIVIGNASAVNLTYNDKIIDMASYKRQDGTARFTLE
ncbi:RodZ domain-containing protein [Nitrosomonas sp.]|uniref:helix-turn-helix domain-containing protein n=1 Tax=Nitrosomonas sp. TaxID=42353 RepID=UPI0025DAA30A|nr:RodZ domain-containing protein [Nitrosomonas sp.]